MPIATTVFGSFFRACVRRDTPAAYIHFYFSNAADSQLGSRYVLGLFFSVSLFFFMIFSSLLWPRNLAGINMWDTVPFELYYHDNSMKSNQLQFEDIPIPLSNHQYATSALSGEGPGHTCTFSRGRRQQDFQKPNEKKILLNATEGNFVYQRAAGIRKPVATACFCEEGTLAFMISPKNAFCNRRAHFLLPTGSRSGIETCITRARGSLRRADAADRATTIG